MEWKMEMDHLTNHLKWEIESICNYLTDLILQRKKLPREQATAFHYILNIAIRLNAIDPEIKNKEYVFNFNKYHTPSWLTIATTQSHIEKASLIFKAFQKTQMTIILKPNKVLLLKRNREIILYENSLSNNALSPIYDDKPFTSNLLKKRYKLT